MRLKKALLIKAELFIFSKYSAFYLSEEQKGGQDAHPTRFMILI
jgi:hypothetical protein